MLLGIIVLPLTYCGKSSTNFLIQATSSNAIRYVFLGGDIITIQKNTSRDMENTIINVRFENHTLLFPGYNFLKALMQNEK